MIKINIKSSFVAKIHNLYFELSYLFYKFDKDFITVGKKT